MSELKLCPLGDRVWVKPIEHEEITPSGIILPETAKEKPQEGRVLAVGPGARDDKGERRPPDVEVGDRVLFAKYAGSEIKLKGGLGPARTRTSAGVWMAAAGCHPIVTKWAYQNWLFKGLTPADKASLL